MYSILYSNIYIIVYNIIYDVIYHSVSPMKWGDLLFLALLSVGRSVCLSVHLSDGSRFRVPSLSVEPLVGFTFFCTNVKYD